MEKFPNPREFRLVGSASEENKKALQRYLNSRFHSYYESLSKESMRRLIESEIPMSPEQRQVIEVLNDVLAEYIEELGQEYHKLPLENYHLIKEEEYIKEKGEDDSLACHSGTELAIFFNEKAVSNSLLLFTAIALHETIHSAMHLAYKVFDKNNDKNDYRFGIYRAGVTVNSYNEKNSHAHFVGLNEAIVSEMQKSIMKKLLDHPKMRELNAEFYNPKHDDEKEKIIKKGVFDIEDLIIDDNTSAKVPYIRNREVLNYICREIAEEMADKYQDDKEVKKVFYRAHVSGHLLEIAHLVEDTFGKGSFRILGNMDINPDSGKLHLEQFKKLRLNFKKQK